METVLSLQWYCDRTNIYISLHFYFWVFRDIILKFNLEGQEGVNSAGRMK